MTVQPAVTLREISFDTVRQVVALDVAEAQRRYVAPNAVSIAEAYFNPGAWFRAIHAGDPLVGFVMLFDPTIPGAIARGRIEPDDVGLWRLMIDQHHQHRGFGRSALNLVCGHVRQNAKFRRLLSSYIPGPDGPEAFYLAYGFVPTGRMRNNDTEIEIVLPLC